MQKLEGKNEKKNIKHLLENLKKNKELHIKLHKKALKFKKKYPDKRKLLIKASILSIKVTKNNIFCTLKNKKKIRKQLSAGALKIHISKKTIKANTKLVIAKFLGKIKRYIVLNRLSLNITCPRRLKKRIVRQLLKFRKKIYKKKIKRFKKKRFIGFLTIKINTKKCFNGCRPVKKIRKKRKRFKATKPKLKK